MFNKEFSNKHRKSGKDFTRKRVFSFGRLILFQINVATKSLNVELSRFFKRIKYNSEEKSYSKQSYCEARMKMKHSAYIELNEELVKGYYADGDYKQFKGHRLLAIDGSRIQLPDKKSVIEEFGIAENGGKPIPMAMSSIAYDVLNKIAVNTYFERYETDERSLADKHLSKIKELTPAVRDIILMDRGYPSLYLFTRMLDLGLDFVVRCNDMSFIREIKEFALSEETDKIIEVDLTTRKYLSIKRLTNRPDRIILRAVKIKLTNGVTEYLISSLTDKMTFTRNDLKELYHLRWGEETYFNFQKNVLEIENFSGRTPETIRQDYYARILSGNIGSLMIEDAQEEIDEQVKINYGQKHTGNKVNRSVAMGLLKDEVIEMLLSPEDQWHIRYNKLVDTIKRYTIPTIYGRYFERKPRLNKAFLKKRKAI
jgi:hypothetical protein